MAKDLQGKNLKEWFLERDEDDPTFVSPKRPPKSSSLPSKATPARGGTGA